MLQNTKSLSTSSARAEISVVLIIGSVIGIGHYWPLCLVSVSVLVTFE